MEVDDYIKNVIGKGDEGSELLNAICAETLKNSDLVDIIEEGMSGIAVLRIPEKYYVAVHSTGGDPEEKDLEQHAVSLVEKLVQQSELINAVPLAFADVIDSNTGDESMLKTAASSLVEISNKYRLVIPTGENAILGVRINPDIEANVSGTMISLVEKNDKLPLESVPGTFTKNGVNYAVFDSEGKAVFINSDGVGTKTEFYERAKRWPLALYDSLAMKLDDTIKFGAIAKAVSDVVEIKGKVPFDIINNFAKKLEEKLAITYILQREIVGGRLVGYREHTATYNISGSVVSIIDEERLKNPLVPHIGDNLIAIKGYPNPRSNGITDLRKTMVDMLGAEWHRIPEGKDFLDYLSSPSTLLYPVFRELIDKGLATAVYHMSGGAFNGKLAKPLAKNGLFVKIENSFPPSIQQQKIMEHTKTPNEVAYAKWPMGNDGFVTTAHQNKDKTIEIIKSYGLEAREAGYIEKAISNVGTGVLLIDIINSKGTPVHFSGK